MLLYCIVFAESVGAQKVSDANTSFILGGVEVARGSTENIIIELPKLYNTPIQLPVRVIRGKEDGPVIFVSAAIHGDELNGIEIIRRFRNLQILEKLKGTVILIPVVNVYGMMNLSRYLPDRRDLNRHFPGCEKGSLASRIADIFFDEIVSKCDLGIDIHTAAIHRSNLPQIRTNIDNAHILKLAKAFEAPVILHSELRDGSLRATAQDMGVPTLLYEAGEALRFDEQSIRIGVKGLVNILIAKGMLEDVEDKKDVKTPIIARSSEWIRAKESGIIRTIKALGDTVSKNEIIAYINAPLDDTSFVLLAPFDGIIIGKSEIPLIQEGDAVFHIARFKDLEVADEKLEYFSEDVIKNSDFCEFNDQEIIE
ncbi:succinylglutamate desuccinylase/aspartoacylase family protein [bacterium]|nr:succinylglutamate desuccinylase/aspartoacylase family protein [bacterium]MBU1990435.1 succinylglutamate desuccinylase/aspartoacylase family protein [bacterium]